MLSLVAIPGFLKGHPFNFATLFTSSSAIKEIGMIVATPIWGFLMKRYRYENLSAIVFAFVSIYLTTLLKLNVASWMLFLAFFTYGIAQAGSHMIWNLSGPYFSLQADSSRYTMVNVFMVGVRGLIMPPLGAVVCHFHGQAFAICLGAFLSMTGAIWILVFSKQQQNQLVSSID